MEKIKPISIKNKERVKLFTSDDNIEIWVLSASHDIPSLLTKKTNLRATITLLENNAITDNILQILDKICSETLNSRNVDHTKTLKENVIARLSTEIDDIGWLYSSSSSSSSRSFSSSSRSSSSSSRSSSSRSSSSRSSSSRSSSSSSRSSSSSSNSDKKTPKPKGK